MQVGAMTMLILPRMMHLGIITMRREQVRASSAWTRKAIPSGQWMGNQVVPGSYTLAAMSSRPVRRWLRRLRLRSAHFDYRWSRKVGLTPQKHYKHPSMHPGEDLQRISRALTTSNGRKRADF